MGHKNSVEPKPSSVTAEPAAVADEAVPEVAVVAAVPVEVVGVPLRYGPVKGARGYGKVEQEASTKIAAVVRGAAARTRVKDHYYADVPRAGGDPLDPAKLGFGPYAENKEQMPTIPDQVRFKVRDETKRQVLLQLGLAEAAGEMHRSADFVQAAHRIFRHVSDRKLEAVPQGPKAQLQRVHLFLGEPLEAAAEPGAVENNNKKQDAYLIGKFDCLAIPIKADYDVAFQELAPPGSPSLDCDAPQGFKGWFWVVHAAAPNIGESAQADDFFAYSREEAHKEGQGFPPGLKSTNSVASQMSTPSRCCWKEKGDRPPRRLDEDLYIRDMGHLWQQALYTMCSLQVTDAILFPFGMGAFLRQLALNDDTYKDPVRFHNLKKRVAAELMEAIRELYQAPRASSSRGRKAVSPKPPERIHLCLVCVNAESNENHNCFVEAACDCLAKFPDLSKILQIRRNVDSFQLAHDLSASKEPLKVALLNGANRKLCGNHWFQDGARFAIDENLHRRSASLSRAALLLNFDTEPRPRKPGQLAQTVRFFRGLVYPPPGLPAPPGSGGPPVPKPGGVRVDQVDGAKGGCCTSVSKG